MKSNTEDTFSITVYDLCSQVDAWKDEAAFWKSKYEEEVALNNKQMNERLEIAKQGIGNALRFMLAVKDDENGNLVINKDDRSSLAENWS